MDFWLEGRLWDTFESLLREVLSVLGFGSFDLSLKKVELV